MLTTRQKTALKASLSCLDGPTDVAEALQWHNSRFNTPKTRAAQVHDEEAVLAFVEFKFFSPSNTTWSLSNGRLIGYKKPMVRTWGPQ